MAPRSKVLALPKAVKEWLDKALVEENFSNYDALTAALKDRGFEISRSAVYRYGAEFESRLAAIKLATEQARAVAEAAPDDDNALSDALIRVVQEKAFSALMQMDAEATKNTKFSTLAKIAGELGFASTNVKQFRQQVKAKASAAASAVAETAKAAGLTDAAVEDIRRRILGIAE